VIICRQVFGSVLLDQELIPYRYSCCSCSSSCAGDAPQKSRFKSERDEIWRDYSSNMRQHTD